MCARQIPFSVVKAHDEHFSKLIADLRAREVNRRPSSAATDASTSINPGMPTTADHHSIGSPTGRVTSVNDAGDQWTLGQEIEEDPHLVFASDSPSPPFLDRGARRHLVEETTIIPERYTCMYFVTNTVI